MAPTEQKPLPREPTTDNDGALALVHELAIDHGQSTRANTMKILNPIVSVFNLDLGLNLNGEGWLDYKFDKEVHDGTQTIRPDVTFVYYQKDRRANGGVREAVLGIINFQCYGSLNMGAYKLLSDHPDAMRQLDPDNSPAGLAALLNVEKQLKHGARAYFREQGFVPACFAFDLVSLLNIDYTVYDIVAQDISGEQEKPITQVLQETPNTVQSGETFGLAIYDRLYLGFLSMRELRAI